MSPRLSLRGVVTRVALLVALLGGVVWILIDAVPGAGDRLADARPGWLAVQIGLEVVSIAGYALLFRATMSYGAERLPTRLALLTGVGELGAFAIVPTGVGGPAVRVWSLRRLGMSLRTLVQRSVVHGVVLNVPYVVAAVLLGAGVVLGIGQGHASLGVALAPVAVVVVSIAIAVVAMVIARRPGPPSPNRARQLARDAAAIVPDGLREVPERTRRSFALLWALAYWAGDSLVLLAAFHTAGGSAPLGVVLLAYMVGQVGNALPLPGGVGGVEPLMLGVLSSSGSGGAVGAAAVVLYRLVSLGMQGLLGAAAIAALVPALRRESSA